jgi:hypothetical protein
MTDLQAIQHAPIESITRDCICQHRGHDEACAAAYLAKLHRALAVEHLAFAHRHNTSPSASGEDEQSDAARQRGPSGAPCPSPGASDDRANGAL